MEPVKEEYGDYKSRLAGEIAELAAEIEVDAFKVAAARTGTPAPDKTAFMGKYVAAPEEAANIIDKTYGGRGGIQHNPKMQELFDKIVEYKRGERSQEGEAHRASLETPVDQGQLDTLKNEIKQLQAEQAEITQLMPDAASKSHADELGKRAKLLEKAEAEKSRKLAELQSTMSRQKFPGGEPVLKDEVYGPQPGQGGWEDRTVVSLEPVAEYMNGLGIDRETLVDRLHKSMRAVGVPYEDWEKPVDPSSGLLRVMGAMDPDGVMAANLVSQMAAAKAEDAAGKEKNSGPGYDEGEDRIARTERAIESRESQLKAIYAQLGQTPFMHTWPGIVLYVLVGMITQNPAFAARLLGGVTNRNAIDAEIKGIQFDLRRLDQRLSHQETERRLTRQEAARRLQKKDDSNEVWRRQVGMTMLNHKLIIQRNSMKNNPETALMKKLQASYQRSVGMAAKYSGEMQNEFAPTDKRNEARNNFNFYMKKAAALDMQLEEMGGDVLEEEPVEE